MKMRQCYPRQDKVIYQAGLAVEARRVLVLIGKVDCMKVGHNPSNPQPP